MSLILLEEEVYDILKMYSVILEEPCKKKKNNQQQPNVLKYNLIGSYKKAKMESRSQAPTACGCQLWDWALGLGFLRPEEREGRAGCHPNTPAV